MDLGVPAVSRSMVSAMFFLSTSDIPAFSFMKALTSLPYICRLKIQQESNKIDQPKRHKDNPMIIIIDALPSFLYFMIQRKTHHIHRHFITLNSRARRHSSLPFFAIKRNPCIIAQFAPLELARLFEFLSLLDLVKFHEALRSSKKTREAAKSIISYIAKQERMFSVGQQKEFMGYTILRKRKLSKWRIGQRRKDNNDWERISMDVDRTVVWFCRSREQLQAMRVYLKRVIFKLCCEVNRFVYVQGFHCIVRAMFEIRLTEQEAYLLGTYFLRDLQLVRYYDNHLQRMREICYVLDVYVYNYLPTLHWHLKRNDLSAQCYAISWFLTLFSQQLPINILSRLWGLFLLKGWKTLIKFALALLFTFQSEIISKREGDLPEFIRDIQLHLAASRQRERILWQLFCSIKVTNKMVTYLCRHMKQLQFDREISITQLKSMRDNGTCIYEQVQSFEAYQYPSSFSLGVCCEKVETSSTFPYCNDYI